MNRLRLLRNLRTFITGCFVIIVIAFIGALIYLNEIGLTKELRDKISQELEKKGIYAEFSAVRFDLIRGIIADDVTIFRTAKREDVAATFAQVSLSMDKTKALRGIIRLEGLTCRDGKANIVINEGSPTERTLVISDFQTDVSLYKGGLLEINESSAQVGNIELEIGASLMTAPRSETKEISSTPSLKGDEGNLVLKIISELESLRMPTGGKPKLKLRLDGDLAKPELIRVAFDLSAPALQKDEYLITEVRAKGLFEGRVLSIDQLSFKEPSGIFHTLGHYDFGTHNGKLDFRCTLDVQNFSKQIFKQNISTDLAISGNSKLIGEILVSAHEDEPIDIKITGNASAQDISFRQLSFSQASSEFSWQNGDLFLRNFQAQGDKGKLTGKLLMKGDEVRYEIDTDIYITQFQDFFLLDSTKEIISQSTFTPDSKSHIKLSGHSSRSNPSTWVAKGQATIDDFNYRTVDLKKLQAKFSFQTGQSLFEDISITFDYKNSEWFKTYKGPATATLVSPRVEIDGKEQVVRIPSVKGTVWPEHALRLFLSQAKKFTAPYRFHSPPSLIGSGVFDLRSSGEKMDFTCAVSGKGETNWKFLGQDLPLKNLTTRLRFRKGRTDVSQLYATLFQGTIRTNLEITYPDDKDAHVAGTTDLTKLSFKELATLYEIKKIDTGQLTGHFEYTVDGGKTETIQGKGNLGLNNSNLFSVPVFGPLSPLLSGIFNDKRAGHERAKNASLTFACKNGIVYFNDFQAETSSLKFIGEGKIDLVKNDLLMTLRMNGKGLLGILNIPLSPFWGLFQFTGSGPLNETDWKTTPFTKPTELQEVLLLKGPTKAAVVPE